jgi:hypothetical protein
MDSAYYDIEFTVLRGAYGGVSFVTSHINVDASARAIANTNDGGIN